MQNHSHINTSHNCVFFPEVMHTRFRETSVITLPGLSYELCLICIVDLQRDNGWKDREDGDGDDGSRNLHTSHIWWPCHPGKGVVYSFSPQFEMQIASYLPYPDQTSIFLPSWCFIYSAKQSLLKTICGPGLHSTSTWPITLLRKVSIGIL